MIKGEFFTSTLSQSKVKIWCKSEIPHVVYSDVM